MVRSTAEVEVSVRRTLVELARHVTVRRAFIFGSHVTGGADEDSDIDVAVFCPEVDDMNVEQKVDLLAQVGFVTREPVEIHLLPDRLLAKATPASFAGFVSSQGHEIDLSQVGHRSQAGT